MGIKQASILARIRPLIEERGYDAVSVDAMATAAGISKATLYRAFPSKEAVRQALLALGVASEHLERRDGREAILDAAMEVFAARGYVGATMDAVAEAAQMSKAGVYWHFASKEAVFATVVARYAPFSTVERIIADGERTDESPQVILTAILTAIVTAITPRFTLFRTIMLESFQNPEMGDVFARDVLGVVIPIVGGYLTRQMEAGNIRQIHSATVLQLLVGPLFLSLFTRDMFASQFRVIPPIDSMIAQIVTTFLDGTRIPKPIHRDPRDT